MIGFATAAGGATIELMEDPGACVGGALSAAYFSPDRKLRIGGCWKLLGNEAVQVAFLDGDIARIPLSAISKPTSM